MVLTVLMLAATLLALLGAGLLALRGARQRSEAASFEEQAAEATAEVVESRAKDVALAGEPVTIYYHLVRWTLADGSPVQAETMTGIQPPVPRVGEAVAIRYDRGHPDRVVLEQADHAAGAGATSFALARILLGLSASLPVAWVAILLIVRYAL